MTNSVTSLRRLRAVVAAATLAITTLAPSAQAGLVVPNDFAAVEGDTNNCIAAGCNIWRRYQQVFASSQFAALGGPQWLTRIAFRADGPTGLTFTHTFSDVLIGLSTTAATPDALSGTFASNRGADFTAVHSGALALSGTWAGAGNLSAFDVVIDFATPFLYDPSQGNLLLDWQDFGTEADLVWASLDATNVVGDSVSRVYSTGASDAVGILEGPTNSIGLIASFDTGLGRVPEPSTIALISAALLGLARSRRRR